MAVGSQRGVSQVMVYVWKNWCQLPLPSWYRKPSSKMPGVRPLGMFSTYSQGPVTLGPRYSMLELQTRNQVPFACLICVGLLQSGRGPVKASQGP
jgi:hypothetical protein